MRDGACFFLPRVLRGDHEKIQYPGGQSSCHHRSDPCRSDGMRRRRGQWRRFARRCRHRPQRTSDSVVSAPVSDPTSKTPDDGVPNVGECRRCSGRSFGQADGAARHRLAQQLQAVVPSRCGAQDFRGPWRCGDRSAQAGRRHRRCRAQPELCKGPHHAAQGVEPRRGDSADSHAADAGRLRAAAPERRPDRKGQVSAAHGVGRQDPVLRRRVLPARGGGAQPVLFGRHRHLQGGASQRPRA